MSRYVGTETTISRSFGVRPLSPAATVWSRSSSAIPTHSGSGTSAVRRGSAGAEACLRRSGRSGWDRAWPRRRADAALVRALERSLDRCERRREPPRPRSGGSPPRCRTARALSRRQRRRPQDARGSAPKPRPSRSCRRTRRLLATLRTRRPACRGLRRATPRPAPTARTCVPGRARRRRRWARRR